MQFAALVCIAGCGKAVPMSLLPPEENIIAITQKNFLNDQLLASSLDGKVDATMVLQH